VFGVDFKKLWQEEGALKSRTWSLGVNFKKRENEWENEDLFTFAFVVVKTEEELEQQ